jgi:transmembrane sensor
VHDGDDHARAEAAAWISADPANAVAYARMDAVWDSARCLRAGPELAIDLGAQDLEPARPRWSATRRGFAAGLIAAAGAGVGLAVPSVRRLLFGQSIHTAIGERRDVALADGSIVRLNTASRVQVRMTETARIVRLIDGEALFDVAHDENRPFLVDVGHARIRAVGTEFNVRIRSELVELTVTEGTVAVAETDERRPLDDQMHVTAGHGALIRRGMVARASLDSESFRQRTAWREGVIELDGNTVEQAVTEFNRYRDKPMVVGDQAIATMRVGGRFGISESEKFLAALQQTLPVRAITGSDGTVMLVSAE